jgi:uncharacterized protein involved in exopolysaccharide biosynthesis
MERDMELKDYLGVIMKWRKIIVFNVIVITVMAAGISLVLPKKYTSATTLLPPVEQPEMAGISTLLGGGLGAVASMAGLPGMTTTSDVFGKILDSRKVMEEVIKRCNLMDEYGAENMEEAVEGLSGATSVEIYPEGVIAISVEASRAALAADIANTYAEELDRFNQEVNMTRGKKNRIFIEDRLEKVKKDLRAAGESLRVFQEKHRTVSLDEEVAAVIQTVSALKAQVAAKEVQLGVLKEYAMEETGPVMRLRAEIAELNRQVREIEYGAKSEDKDTGFGAGFSVPFARLPAVGLELARLTREAEIQALIFELLTQQYEQAKIMEAKDTPTIQVLDRAVPPERKSFPQRKKLVAVGFVFSLFVGMVLAFVLEFAEQVEARPQEYGEWMKMGDEVKADFRIITREIFRRKKR